MIRPRIIPSLLIKDKGIVKTINFKNAQYIGDPLNTVRIFSEKEADEIVIFDIDASMKNCKPDFSLLEKIAKQCKMPICYGGGIKNDVDAKKILELGIEKIAVSSLFFENIEMVSKIIKIAGSQSVVLVLDIKEENGQYMIYINNGEKKVSSELHDTILRAEQIGIGEIIINSIDKDGTMSGYDINLLKVARDITHLPLTFLGGASCLDDIKKVINYNGNGGVAAGSFFVYYGRKNAVLVTYPTNEEKNKLFN